MPPEHLARIRVLEWMCFEQTNVDGASWEAVGGKHLSLKTLNHPNCANGWIVYGNGEVGPDGTVYISLHRCGRLAIAVSADEGNSWNIVEVPGTTLLPFTDLVGMVTRANALLTEPLAIDADGTLYLVWPDEAGQLQYSISRDKAQSWRAPIVVSEPNVRYTVYGGTAVRKPGTLAIAYYGSKSVTRVLFTVTSPKRPTRSDAQPGFSRCA